MHKGPYETLGRAYQMLHGAWLPQSGRELRDVPCFEVYLNSPQSTHPEELLTLIHVPASEQGQWGRLSSLVVCGTAGEVADDKRRWSAHINARFRHYPTVSLPRHRRAPRGGAGDEVYSGLP